MCDVETGSATPWKCLTVTVKWKKQLVLVPEPSATVTVTCLNRDASGTLAPRAFGARPERPRTRSKTTTYRDLEEDCRGGWLLVTGRTWGAGRTGFEGLKRPVLVSGGAEGQHGRLMSGGDKDVCGQDFLRNPVERLRASKHADRKW